MKKFKHLKKFNELNSSTYSSAAKKADEYGRKDLAKRLRRHSFDSKSVEGNESITIEYHSENTNSDIVTNLGFIKVVTDFTLDVWTDTDGIGINGTRNLFISLAFIDDNDDIMNIEIGEESMNVLGAYNTDDEGDTMDFKCVDRLSAKKLKKLLIYGCDQVESEIDKFDDQELLLSELDKLRKLSVHKFLK